jgi:hypothetical protein
VSSKEQLADNLTKPQTLLIIVEADPHPEGKFEAVKAHEKRKDNKIDSNGR